MKSVTVNRDELLKKIQENRAKHKEEYDKAISGFKEKTIEKLSKMLSDAKAGVKFSQSTDLIKPTHQLKDYDRVIAMLEMSVDEEVCLQSEEFSQYVLDNWIWKQNFTTTTALYS